MQNAVIDGTALAMAVQVTIRDVPEAVRNELAAREATAAQRDLARLIIDLLAFEPFAP